jgi:hypothetical protein
MPPGRSEPSCEEIRRLQGLIGKEMSADSLQTWVREMYDLPSSQVTVESFPVDSKHLVSWEKHSVSYLAVLKGLVLSRIDVDSTWAANHFITCLGQPAWYSASYSKGVEMNQLHLALLYPDQGLLVNGYNSLRPWVRQPPRMDGRFPTQMLSVLHPGTAEQVIYQKYGEVLCGYRSWPGSWEGIVVDIDPSLQP